MGAALEYAVRSPLLHSHRADDRTDYYYLANGSPSAPVDHDGVPPGGLRDAQDPPGRSA